MGRHPLGAKPMTSTERSRLHRAKHRPAKPAHATLVQELAAAKTEIAALKARMRNAAPTASLPPRPRPAAADAAPATPDAAREIKRLKALLADARGERNFLRQWSRTTEIPEKGGMSFKTHSKIMKALHPDYTPTKAERAEACQAFTEWGGSLKRAPSRGSFRD